MWKIFLNEVIKIIFYDKNLTWQIIKVTFTNMLLNNIIKLHKNEKKEEKLITFKYFP